MPGGIRTPDILLRRQALYPLSYRHVSLRLHSSTLSYSVKSLFEETLLN